MLWFFHPWAWYGLGLLIPLLFLNYGYGELIRQLAGEAMSDVDPFLELRKAVGPWGMILLIAVFPGVTEEVAFRAMVQHWLQIAIKPRHAIILASALFMALHFNILGAPYLFMVGCLLGWVKYKTGSLYPSMLIHGLHNYVVIAYMT